MLCLPDHHREAEFRCICQTDAVFGTTILSLWHSHRDNWRDFSAWLGTDGRGKPRYALCRYGRCYTLCAPKCLTPFSRDELCAFLRLEPNLELEGDGAVLKNLPLSLPLEEKKILSSSKKGFVKMENISICKDYTALCRFIQQEQALDREKYLSKMFPLFRNGMCLPFVFEINHKILACGLLELGEKSSYGLISTVITDKKQRGRGIGRLMVQHLCACCEEQQRIPCLVCAEDRLTDFYMPLGFEILPQRYGLLKGKPE